MRFNYPKKVILLILTILFGASVSQADDSLSPKSRLNSCDPNVRKSAAYEIINNPSTLKEPLDLFAPTTELFMEGKKDEAVFWLYAAQLRTRYQIAVDGSGQGDRGQLLAIMMMAVAPAVNSYAFQDTSKLNRTLDRVLDWDKKTPNPLREKAKSESVSQQVEKVYEGFHDLKSKLSTEKVALESEAKKQASQYDQMMKYSSFCSKSRIVAEDTEKEWSQVINFVENNADVLKKSGDIQKTDRVSTNAKGAEDMPTRYKVSVVGSSGQEIDIFVDVIRPNGSAKFKLTCIEQLSSKPSACAM